MMPVSPFRESFSSRLPTVDYSSSSAQRLIEDLLAFSLIRSRDWESLSASSQQGLMRFAEEGELLKQLVQGKLLTAYQADRIRARKLFGLILGNYRVLDRLGAGGMGIVFKGEHLRLPRVVAIKVLSLSQGQDPRLLRRFLTEMWAAAQLNHPNIVSAIDAGETAGSDPDAPVLHYFVMDHVAGLDLEDYVKSRGPLAPTEACDLIHQTACALAEAHKHNLVHRDIKPSNIMVTSERQAKLLDFGLARHFGENLTEPGRVLGTIDYIAPEQAQDSSSVDIRADIYSLGGTLFWCLTGRRPFPREGTVMELLARRLTQSPPSVRHWQPNLPAGLDDVVSRMMAVDPQDRYPNPDEVMRALLPFLKPESSDHSPASRASQSAGAPIAPSQKGTTAPRVHKVLVVDDEPAIRDLCRMALEGQGIQCDKAANGIEALLVLHEKQYDLVLSDIDMPQMTGPELLQRIRNAPPCPHLKVIMFSGRASADEMAQLLSLGADDYLSKPLSLVQLLSRVKAALRLKDAQDRSDLLNRQMLSVNAELERNLNLRDGDLVHARNALVLALAELVSQRGAETGAHLVRLQRYCRCLGEETACFSNRAEQVDSNFIQMLECCVPLHDIGKVALPDHILLKPGKLDADERIMMETHTIVGADMLQKVATRHGCGVAFLHMAIDIARHHHERFDGLGYPDQLTGEDIPLAARIVTVADVYDALRSRRSYKPALSHAVALQIMAEGSPGHFDPLLLEAFQQCAPKFERIYQELAD